MTAAERARLKALVSAQRRTVAPFDGCEGSEGRYRAGCRCEACRTAARVARTKRRQNCGVKTHNASGYANGCRCDVCRTEHNRYLKAWKAARRAA